MQCIGVVYIETQRDIHQCATDELVNAGMDGIHLRYVNFDRCYITISLILIFSVST